MRNTEKKLLTRIPAALKPLQQYDLIRLGKDNDGGYLVTPDSIDNADALLSLGISFDWSFEQSFSAHKPNAPIHAYDGTVDVNVIRNRAEKNMRAQKKGKRLPYKPEYTGQVYEGFLAFFDGKQKNFYKEMIGSEDGFTSLSTSIARIAEQSVFLSCDIEGAEYQIFAEIIANIDVFCGIVLEIHDFSTRAEEVTAFCESLQASGMMIVHVHGNNSSVPIAPGVPDVLEISFARQAKVMQESPSFPHALDQPCNDQSEDYTLLFENDAISQEDFALLTRHTVSIGIASILKNAHGHFFNLRHLDRTFLQVAQWFMRREQPQARVAMLAPISQSLLEGGISAFEQFMQGNNDRYKQALLIVSYEQNNTTHTNLLAEITARANSCGIEVARVPHAKSKRKSIVQLRMLRILHHHGVENFLDVHGVYCHYKLALVAKIWRLHYVVEGLGWESEENQGISPTKGTYSASISATDPTIKLDFMARTEAGVSRMSIDYRA